MLVTTTEQKGIAMVNNDSIQHLDPELKELLFTYLKTTSNLCEFMNSSMTMLLNTIMSLQADEVCQAQYNERTDKRTNCRNGYRKRILTTSVGSLHLLIPKLRKGTYFPENIFSRWARIDRAVICAVAEMYVSGTSTRKIEKVAKSFGIESISKDQVSKLCSILDKDTHKFLHKDWSDINFAYLFLDATYLKCHAGSRVRNEAFLTAIGIGSDGHKHFLGFTCSESESYESWLSFLEDLKSRGVDGVKLITSDAHNGLKRAITQVYPQASWQRCITHVKREVIQKISSKKNANRACAIMSPIFKEKDPSLVRALYHEAVEQIEAISPKAAKVLEDAETDALTYLSFPQGHHLKIRTNNIQERMNAELKRRARVVGCFHNTSSIERLLGAIAIEENSVWETGRMCMSPESVAVVLDIDKKRVRLPRIKLEAKKKAQAIIQLAIDELEDVS